MTKNRTAPLQKAMVQRIMKVHRPKNRKIYIVDGKEIVPRKRIGLMVAGLLPGKDEVAIGFCLCNKKDRYNFYRGQHRPDFDYETAVNRAIKWFHSDKQVEVPPSIEEDFMKFINRCKLYYKDKKVNDEKFVITKEELMDRDIFVNSLIDILKNKFSNPLPPKIEDAPTEVYND